MKQSEKRIQKVPSANASDNRTKRGEHRQCVSFCISCSSFARPMHTHTGALGGVRLLSASDASLPTECVGRAEAKTRAHRHRHRSRRNETHTTIRRTKVCRTEELTFREDRAPRSLSPQGDRPHSLQRTGCACVRSPLCLRGRSLGTRARPKSAAVRVEQKLNRKHCLV